MAVTASDLSLESLQADGRRWAVETHTITGGALIMFRYLKAVADDAAAIMAARVALVAAQAAEDEAIANINRDGALTLLQQTGAQMAARLREEIRNADKQWACYLAWWLLRRIAAGNLTDAQCQSAFNLSPAAWTSLKTNTLTPRSDAWAAMLAATGA